MMKKIGHIALLFLLLSQSFLSGFSHPAEVKAAIPEQDLITQVSLLDEEGKVIDFGSSNKCRCNSKHKI